MALGGHPGVPLDCQYCVCSNPLSATILVETSLGGTVRHHRQDSLLECNTTSAMHETCSCW